jgi:hypothetical protein
MKQPFPDFISTLLPYIDNYTTICELGAKATPKPYKPWFVWKGKRHVSIDLSGEHGSLQLDLTKPIDPEILGGRFDVVTNFGTSEHVHDQFECWKNILNLCKENGIICCSIPVPGYWDQHGTYYPHYAWYRQLAAKNKLTIMSYNQAWWIRGLVNNVQFRKDKQTEFILPNPRFMHVELTEPAIFTRGADGTT